MSEKKMNVFVVLSNHGVHHDCMGLFSTEEKAKAFLHNNDVHQGYIKLLEIIGDFTYPADVFEANSYLPEWKVHTFIGLYADPSEAESVAGVDGLVLPRTIDEK